MTATSHHNVRFGDVAREVSETCRNPIEAGFERYVGLEHIDPESLQLKRWGLLAEDNPTFTKVFRAGQLLFGRRRAYQRKAAVADFDGVCSGDIIVMEVIPGCLLPELLPFVVQSEGFYKHALSTSAGSLSPRTKWSALAQYEFALPPLDEQRRIADILWAVEDTINSYAQAQQDAFILKTLMNSKLTLRGTKTETLKNTKIGAIPSHWQLVRIGDVLNICQYGTSDRADDNSRYPIFRMMNIDDGVIVENDMKYIDLDAKEFEKYRLEPGDILFNRTNSFDLVGKVGIYRLNGDHVFASYLIRLRVDQEIVNPEYLNYYLNSAFGQAQIRRFITPGVSQSNINAKNLQQVPFPLPPLEEQLSSVGLLFEIDQNVANVSSHIHQLGVLKRGMLQNLLGPQHEVVNVQ